MTPAEFEAARESLGMSRSECARVFGLSGYRAVHKIETSDTLRDGPTVVLMGIFAKAGPNRWRALLPDQPQARPRGRPTKEAAE